jgi:hypothetical protein
MPNLTDHPEVSGWVAPEDRDQALPSRLELMIAAVETGFWPIRSGKARPRTFTWRCRGRSAAGAGAGAEFLEDYFPHGGVVGAARMGLPRAIIEAPPESLATIFDPTADLLARLGAVSIMFRTTSSSETEVGTLGFYVPAPNPPIFTDAQGNA